jgi:hypothetical protein
LSYRAPNPEAVFCRSVAAKIKSRNVAEKNLDYCGQTVSTYERKGNLVLSIPSNLDFAYSPSFANLLITVYVKILSYLPLHHLPQLQRRVRCLLFHDLRSGLDYRRRWRRQPTTLRPHPRLRRRRRRRRRRLSEPWYGQLNDKREILNLTTCFYVEY